jgi:hypothetical protein
MKITNKGLVPEFSERKLGTNPWFKKPRHIGEKVAKAEGQKEGFEIGKTRTGS